MGNQQAVNRVFMIKAGMTPKDVINSKEATAQQKKMAYVFDSDGMAGYSQREADVFNATLITDRGQDGISLWTRYNDGSKKETKYSGDISRFKFAPKGDVKPYVLAKGKKAKSNTKQLKNIPIKTTLPPLTQLQGLDTLTFYSKQDSIHYNIKDKVAYDKYANADDAAFDKYDKTVDAALHKNEETFNEIVDKYENKQITRHEMDSIWHDAYNEFESVRSNAYNEWQTIKNNSFNEWKSVRSIARQKHCSQVREYQP